MRITVPAGHVRPLEWFYDAELPCPACGSPMEGEATLSENSVFGRCPHCGGVQVFLAPKEERTVIPFLRGKHLGLA